MHLITSVSYILLLEQNLKDNFSCFSITTVTICTVSLHPPAIRFLSFLMWRLQTKKCVFKTQNKSKLAKMHQMALSILQSDIAGYPVCQFVVKCSFFVDLVLKCVIIVATLVTYGSKDVNDSQSIGSSLYSRMEYLNSCWMDCHKIQSRFPGG